MKRFNEWCDRMDVKLKDYIESKDFKWKDLLYILFPISSSFFKK